MERNSQSMFVIAAAAFITVLTIRFVILPYWLTSHIHKHLQEVEGYSFSFDKLDLSIVTGTITLRKLRIAKGDELPQLTMLEVDEFQVSPDWTALINGTFTGNIHIKRPVVNIMYGQSPHQNLNTVSEALSKSFPTSINKISVANGEIHFYNAGDIHQTILVVTDVHLTASNLANALNYDKALFGLVEGSAKVMGADLKLNGELNTLQRMPTFNLNAELHDLNLNDIQGFLSAYGDFQTQNGLFSLFAQAGTRNNKIVGYAKPLIEDVSLASLNRENRNGYAVCAGATEWKTIVPSGNHKQIEFEGLLSRDHDNLWTAISVTLHNAFVEGLIAMLHSKPGGMPKGRHNPGIRPQEEDSSKLSREKKRKNRPSFGLVDL